MLKAGCQTAQYLCAKIAVKHICDKKVEINWFVQASGKKMSKGEV